MKFNGIIALNDGVVNAVVEIDGCNKSITVDKTHSNYDGLMECLETGDAEEFMRLYDLKEAVFQYSGEYLEVDGSSVKLNGESVPQVFLQTVLDMISNAINPVYMENFIKNLLDNPSKLTITHLYDFMQHGSMPITEDGCFLAYKGVNENFTDVYTGTIDNTPGSIIPRMKRAEVDDDRNVGCSYGYHAGSLEYAKGWARGKVVIVKINPKDVVSVPEDCNFQKLRCSFYEIVSEYNKRLEGPVSSLDQKNLSNCLVEFNRNQYLVLEHYGTTVELSRIDKEDFRTEQVEDIVLLSRPEKTKVKFCSIKVGDIITRNDVPCIITKCDYDKEHNCTDLDDGVKTITNEHDDNFLLHKG